MAVIIASGSAKIALVWGGGFKRFASDNRGQPLVFELF